jgi:osmoprotectant transport system substrate-binding protein
MTNRPARWLLAVLVPLALGAAACGDDDEDPAAEGTTSTAGEGGGTCSEASAPDGAPAITIGAQDFGESAILAQIYSQCLEAAGFDVSVQEVGGFRDLELAAFEGGDINLAPEYAASMLEALNGHAGEATADATETTDLLNGYLADIGLVAATPSDAVDTNAFVVKQETSDELGITTISDLADHTDLTLGAPADCETNAFCLPGLESVYGIDLSAGFIALETAAIAPALDADEIQIGLLFSTDSRIVVNDYVLLEDDEGMLAADNVVPVFTQELSEVEGLVELLDAVSATLTTEGLTELNRRFDVDVEDADAVALSFLQDNGLL